MNIKLNYASSQQMNEQQKTFLCIVINLVLLKQKKMKK